MLSTKDTKRSYSPNVQANQNHWPFPPSLLLTGFKVLAYSHEHRSSRWLPLSLPPSVPGRPFSAADAMPFMCPQSAPSLLLLPHPFTLVNFLSSLTLFVACSPGISYFHRCI